MTNFNPIEEVSKIDNRSDTAIEEEDFLGDKRDLIVDCFSKSIVKIFFSRAITKMLLASTNKSRIFQELQEEFQKSEDCRLLGLQNKAKNFETFCEILLKNDNHDYDCNEDLILLSEFYQSLDYSYFMNLLFRYDLSVDDIHVEKQKELNSLFKQLNKLRNRENGRALPITSGFFLGGGGVPNNSMHSNMSWINQRIAPRFFWGRELLQFYFSSKEAGM